MEFLKTQVHESDHDTIQEYFGYAMSGHIQAQKMLVLNGVSRSGKSTALNVLQALVGPELTYSATLADLGTEFGLESCVGKRLFKVPDAQSVSGPSRARALERIKSIVGCDAISINRKHMKAVSHRLPIRIAVACNRLPEFIDESRALANRLVIIQFDKEVPTKDVNSELEQELLAEMSGIANWAIAGLSRLRFNNFKFTLSERGAQAAQNAAIAQSPAAQFAADCMEVTGNKEDFVIASELYRVYKEYAREQGLKGKEVRSLKKLTDDLVAAFGAQIECKQKRIKHQRPRVIAGVKLKRSPEYSGF